MKNRILLPLLLAGLAVPASATVTITLEFAFLRSSSQSPTAGSYMLVADSDGDGVFPTAAELGEDVGSTLNDLANQFIGGADASTGDRVFSVGSMDSDGYVNTGVASVSLTTLGVVTGDRWGILWFPGVGLDDQRVVGQSFGSFHSSTVDQAIADMQPGVIAMVFPADGNADTTIYYDASALTDFGGTPTGDTPSVAQFSATSTIIPEPSVALLGLLGLVGFARRRRA